VLGPIRAASSIPYLVLALLVGVVQYYSTLLMQFFQGIDPFKKKEKADKNNPQPIAPDEMQAQMSKSMNLILPVLTILIAIGYPAVLALYWFVQSVVMMVQYVLMDPAKSKEFFMKLFRRGGKSNVNEVKKELPVIIKDAQLVRSSKNRSKKVKK
jgi:membrane protein insertase Oxa1/YidC/SpoIIIJ